MTKRQVMTLFWLTKLVTVTSLLVYVNWQHGIWFWVTAWSVGVSAGVIALMVYFGGLDKKILSQASTFWSVWARAADMLIVTSAGNWLAGAVLSVVLRRWEGVPIMVGVIGMLVGWTAMLLAFNRNRVLDPFKREEDEREVERRWGLIYNGDLAVGGDKEVETALLDFASGGPTYPLPDVSPRETFWGTVRKAAKAQKTLITKEGSGK